MLDCDVIETMTMQNIIGKATNCSIEIYKEPIGDKSTRLMPTLPVTFNTQPTTNPRKSAMIFTNLDLLFNLSIRHPKVKLLTFSSI